MNLTKLASGAYVLKVTIGDKETTFASNEFANANQLHKVLAGKLEGISSLKKSTFYGVKFEEIVPGVFVGERRIPGFGLYHFQFTGAPVALDVPFDNSKVEETKPGCCGGNAGCGGACKVSITEAPLSSIFPANEATLEIESGFKISELGAGTMTVYEDGQYVCAQSFSDSGNLSSETVFAALLVKVYPGVAQPSHDMTFIYDEDKDAFVAAWEEYNFLFRKAKTKLTLKETFLGWLKNILG